MAVTDILIFQYINQCTYYEILISIVHGVELKVLPNTPCPEAVLRFSYWDGEWPRKADILLQTLDARDPQYCRCAELEAWATQKLRSKQTPCDHGIVGRADVGSVMVSQ